MRFLPVSSRDHSWMHNFGFSRAAAMCIGSDSLNHGTSPLETTPLRWSHNDVTHLPLPDPYKVSVKSLLLCSLELQSRVQKCWSLDSIRSQFNPNHNFILYCSKSHSDSTPPYIGLPFCGTSLRLPDKILYEIPLCVLRFMQISPCTM
jgi:hypothetical protein